MLEAMHKLVDMALTLPGVVDLRKKRFDRAFSSGQYGGACRGLFSTYAEAAAAAPKTLPLGYDHAETAAMYRDRLGRVFPSDYAMMLWLEKALLSGARRIFDLGGHVGVGYYAYQKHLAYPADLSWTVCDVPAVVQQGAELARERDTRKQLAFTADFSKADGSDVLFTSGCLQYLEDTLADRLAALREKPEWLLINLLPLHEIHAYWTVQNIGRAFCPYRIQRAADFFESLAQAGYELIDKWDNLEKSCEVHFQPSYSLDRYYGAALRKRR